MSGLFAGVKLDPARYDACMSELRKIGASFEPGVIKRTKARIAAIYPELEGYLFAVALKLALVEWRTPSEREKERQAQAELKIAVRVENAERRDQRQGEKEARVTYARQHGITVDQIGSHMMQQAVRSMTTYIEKAEKFDEVEALLDAWVVGDTPLGDCTREQLLAAAAEWAKAGGVAVKRAGMYRKIAADVGPGETVRTASRLDHLLSVLRESVFPVTAFRPDKAPAVRSAAEPAQ
jgi:hypothetical protein